MKPTAASNVRVFELASGALLLTHQLHPKRIVTHRLPIANGEDIEATIQGLEDTIASLKSMRDRLEAEK